MKIKNEYGNLQIVDCEDLEFETVSDSEKDAIVYSDKDNKMAYLSGVAAYIYLIITREFQAGTAEISSEEIARMIIEEFETEGTSLLTIIDDVGETIRALVELEIITVK